MTAESRRSSQIIAWTLLVAVLSAVVVGLLLARSLFAVQAQSFDALLYARGLSGLARGDAYNPVAGINTLGVHGHFGLLALAPLARVMPAAGVLILAQAAAFGATVGLVAGALGFRAARSGGRWGPRIAIGWAGVALIAGSPLVVNPFLFDARPDLLAVPLVLGGLLRWNRRGQLDRAAIILILAACLVREEFAMTAFGAFVFAPLPWRGPSARRRVAGAALAIAYWALYWAVGREWLGGAIAVERVSDAGRVLLGSSADHFASNWWAAWPYKLEILVAALGTLGGGALLGWRWLGVALPGLVFLLAMNRRADEVIVFHYAMFAAPGLLMAGISGARRAISRMESGLRVRSGRAGIAASLVVAGIMMSVSGALPHGGRHQRDFFLLDGDAAELQRYDSARALLAVAPYDAGLAVPYMLAASEADRIVVIPTSRYAELVRPPLEAPESIDWIALLPSDWADLGRALVQLDDFVLVAATPWLALIRRRTEFAGLAMPPGVTAPHCERPIGLWPAAGLALCRPVQNETGHLQVAVTRTSPPNESLAEAPMSFALAQGDVSIGVTIFHGLVALRDLSPGQTVLAISDEPVAGSVELQLIHIDGRPIPMAVSNTAVEPMAGRIANLGVPLDLGPEGSEGFKAVGAPRRPAPR